jgi:hypothetical protein
VWDLQPVLPFFPVLLAFTGVLANCFDGVWENSREEVAAYRQLSKCRHPFFVLAREFHLEEQIR